MTTAQTTAPATNDRLKASEYIGYALGDTASNFFFQTFNIFLTYYYVDVWGIPATVLLWLIPLVRAFGAFDDVIMGLIADRTNTRWGKFRPYLLFGAIPYGICGYLMFAGPDFGPNGKIVYAAITYALMMVSYTVINVPYSAMLGVISPSPRTRTVASTCRFVGAFGAAFLISLFVRPLVKHLGAGNEIRGFQLTMAIFAVVSVVLILITFATTKERVTPPPQQKTNVREELGELFKNWPWVVLLITSIFSNAFSALRSGSTIFYFKYVQGYDSTSDVLGLGSHHRVPDQRRARPGAGHRVPRSHRAEDGQEILRRRTQPGDRPVFSRLLLRAERAVRVHGRGEHAGAVLRRTDFRADLGALRRCGRLWRSEVRAPLHRPDLLGLSFLHQDRHSHRRFPRAAVPGAVWLCERRGNADRHALLGIAIAFSIGPALFALLKAVALLIYPLNQKRVDEIERNWPRAAPPSPEIKPA